MIIMIVTKRDWLTLWDLWLGFAWTEAAKQKCSEDFVFHCNSSHHRHKFDFVRVFHEKMTTMERQTIITFHGNYNRDEVSIMVRRGGKGCRSLRNRRLRGDAEAVWLSSGNCLKLTCKFNELANRDRNYLTKCRVGQEKRDSFYHTERERRILYLTLKRMSKD